MIFPLSYSRFQGVVLFVRSINMSFEDVEEIKVEIYYYYYFLAKHNAVCASYYHKSRHYHRNLSVLAL